MSCSIHIPLSRYKEKRKDKRRERVVLERKEKPIERIIGEYGSSVNSFLSSKDSLQFAGGLPSNLGTSVIIGTSTFGLNPEGIGISSSWMGGGTDYAEYFEWEDGNPSGKDLYGYFVSLSSDKIRLASEDPIGITSDVSGFVGDSAELAWKGCSETDILLRRQKRYTYMAPLEILLREVPTFLQEVHSHDYPDDDHLPIAVSQLPTCPKELIPSILEISPIIQGIHSKKFDPQREYIPRSQRKEWIKVGLIGKIPVYDDGTCIEGEKCDCKNGIATKGSRWNVMKRISPYTVLILFK